MRPGVVVSEEADEGRRTSPDAAGQAAGERSVHAMSSGYDPGEASDEELLLEALGDAQGLASDAFARFHARKRGLVRNAFLATVKGTASQDLEDFESWFWHFRLWQGKRGGGTRVEDLARARALDAYLRSMAHNAALDWWRSAAVAVRRGGQGPETLDVADPRSARPALLDAELAVAVLRALRHAVPVVAQRLCVLASLCLEVLDADRATAALDGEERSFLRARGAVGLLLRGDAGLSRKAVGEALGFSHDAARQVVSRGMRALRSHVRGCVECRLDWLLPE